jgi:2,4-diketo-3-deoxy-L-fuconate hydrolase
LELTARSGQESSALPAEFVIWGTLFKISKGNRCDSFGPIGPWLVTPDEVGDPNDLDMWLDVNGRRFQSGSTKTMIFRPTFLISYLSQFMSLQAGDIISTGTPPGVGLGQKPPLF